jgi:NAD(P)H dehydrogenase (quinone)
MIIVTGASGYIGSKAVSRLLERGLPVTAMGRNAGRLRQALPSGVRMAIADYDDPPSLDQAFAGAAKLLFVASDGFANDMLRQHANVIAAANRSAIMQVVFTSIVDIEESSPFYYAPVYRDAEQKLKASRFASSIIRWASTAISSSVTGCRMSKFCFRSETPALPLYRAMMSLRPRFMLCCTRWTRSGL